MNNPLNIWKNLKETYKKYIDTSLPLAHRKLELEREELLNSGDLIARYPSIEFTPKYQEYKTVQETVEELNLDVDFIDLVKAGLFEDINGKSKKLYKHQYDGLNEAVVKRKNIIATTGTGSGKTETFLLPLFYDIFKAKKRDNTSSVKGLILYPLNALAEDQMVRLRKSLTSNEAANFFKNKLNNNYITFGRYTGSTVKSKKEGDFEKDWNQLKKLFVSNPEMENLRYDIANTDLPIELWSREQIIETPPDLLITNYSMLNVMLYRETEQDIFLQTKKWLEESPENIFHIVIDELHSYRGTGGTEVAYLIRKLLNKLGLKPNSSQVQFLCSSASMQETDRTKKFITGFFGQETENYNEKFKIIQSPKKSIIEPFIKPWSINTFDNILTFSNSVILSIFKSEKVLETLGFYFDNSNTNSKEMNDIAPLLFKDGTIELQIEILSNILEALSKIKDENGNVLQSFRVHYFFRNLDGLWACSNKNCTEVKEDFNYDNRTVGKLYRRPQSVCQCGSKIFEILTCRTCGETYFNGWFQSQNNPVDIQLNLDKGIQESKFDNKVFTYIKDDFDSQNWSLKSYDSINGVLKSSSIKSNVIEYIKSDEYLSLYPHSCFSCDSSKSLSQVTENTLTPVHRHYTGVQKINQLMADSLSRELSIINGGDKSKSKLVLFSDSRQSAAKLSAGIELDHYKDIIRFELIQFLKSVGNDNFLSLIVEFLKDPFDRKITKQIKELYKENPSYKKFYDLIDSFLDNDPNENQIKSKIIEVNNSDSLEVDINSTIDKIQLELLNLGINPGGPKFSLLHNKEDKNEEDWYEIYYDQNSNIEIKSENNIALYERNRKSLKYEILTSLFSGNRRSFESLGLAYVDAVIKNYKGYDQNIIQNCIRIMGESYRISEYDSSQFIYSSLPRKVQKYVKQCGITYNGDFKKSLLEILDDNKLIESNHQLRLTGNNLQIKSIKEKEKVYRCSSCQNIQIRNYQNVCTNCFKPNLSLISFLDLKEVQENNYYIHLIKITDKSQRLHCEELTGQTDSNDARNRQRFFQARFLDDENSKVKEIDLLSVTTTMEAGVDIGSLNAVMMANVPPQRFNYQQRVGRAGRRGAPMSIALTIAKGNSHDQSHYQETSRMISSIPSDPYLELRQVNIMERFIFKDILMTALKESLTIDELNNKSDVHGNLGLVLNWSNRTKVVQSYIETNKESILELINSYKVGTDIQQTDIELYNLIEYSLVNQISEKVSENLLYPQLKLSERLAAGGLLPMFGFPTQVRNLYEKPLNNRHYRDEEFISRNLSRAISEFAPGSQIIKDKKIIKPIGFVSYIYKNGRLVEEDGRGKLDRPVYKCTGCSSVFVETDVILECPICNSTLNEYNAYMPKGFISDENPQDFDGRFEFSSRSGNVSLDPSSHLIEKNNFQNLIISSNNIPKEAKVIQINDNDGKLFDFNRVQDSKKWVLSKKQNANTETAVLISIKHTGVLTIGLKKIYDLPILNININAIFESWGYLIRKSICSELDIESNEFEIGFRINPQSKSPEIFIVETADNGAGYTNFLSDPINSDVANKIFIENLLPNGSIYKILMNQDHQYQCISSCYDCLRDYYNSSLHRNLNWRLALDLAEVSANVNTVLKFQQSHWKRYKEFLFEVIKKSKVYDSIEIVDDFIIFSKSGKKILLTHPLWELNHINYLLNELDCSESINFFDISIR